MFYPVSLFIGFRYIYGQKHDSFGRFVSWLSMIGIMLGSAGLIIVMSVMNGLEYRMQGQILQFIPHAQITTTAQRVNIDDYPKNVIEQFVQTHHLPVTHIAPLVTGDVILQSINGITVTSMIGVDPTEYEPIKNDYYIYFGDINTLVNGQYNMIISATLATTLNVIVGDQVRLMVTDASQITPVGRIPVQRLFTISGIFSVNREVNQSQVYLNIDDAAKLLKYPKNTITSWRLFLENPLNIEQVAATQLPDNFEMNDWRAKKGALFQAIKMEKNVMGLLISLIVIVASFNIITSLSLLVMEKQNEVAILKTLGLSSKKVMLIFMIQGGSSGIIGTILGCLFGLGITINLDSILTMLNLSLNGIRLPILIDWTQVSVVFVALIALSILSTLYPAYRAASIQPAQALRYE